MLKSRLMAEGEMGGISLPDWIGECADLTLVLDEAGVIRSVGCRDVHLWQEMEGAGEWIGRPWSSTASLETRSAVDILQRAAKSNAELGNRHIDQLTSNGRSIPLLCSAFLAGAHVVVFGRDLRSMDLTQIALEHDVSTVHAYAKAMRLRGMKLETLCLDVLAPAARRLGDLWLDDACSFTDVTVGVGHLEAVLRNLFFDKADGVGEIVESKRILLAVAPGEQHTFGLAIVAGFFRRAGWFVQHENITSGAALAQAVARRWFAVIGLSSSDSGRLDDLAACIRKLRKASHNKAVRIMVGGRVFTDQPELCGQVEADFVAYDARQAVHRAQHYLDGCRETS